MNFFLIGIIKLSERNEESPAKYIRNLSISGSCNETWKGVNLLRFELCSWTRNILTYHFNAGSSFCWWRFQWNNNSSSNHWQRKIRFEIVIQETRVHLHISTVRLLLYLALLWLWDKSFGWTMSSLLSSLFCKRTVTWTLNY